MEFLHSAHVFAIKSLRFPPAYVQHYSAIETKSRFDLLIKIQMSRVDSLKIILEPWDYKS